MSKFSHDEAAADADDGVRAMNSRAKNKKKYQ